jgi:hypothetical protein
MSPLLLNNPYLEKKKPAVAVFEHFPIIKNLHKISKFEENKKKDPNGTSVQ